MYCQFYYSITLNLWLILAVLASHRIETYSNTLLLLPNNLRHFELILNDNDNDNNRLRFIQQQQQRQQQLDFDSINDDEKQRRFFRQLKLYKRQTREKREKENYDDSDDVVSNMNKRLFFLKPDRRMSMVRNPRPEYKYGRKAHWDTFFG